MEVPFRDRVDAGRQLASRLTPHAGRDDVVVLALPRGGVAVAYEVARALGVSLDVFVVRKLGVPGHEELAMGAIASGGVRVLHDPVVRQIRDAGKWIEAATEREQRELQRREREYRDGRPALVPGGKIVILVDDGLATGSTMRAAVKALRMSQVAKLIVAVPVGAPETCTELQREVDELICLVAPEDFQAVGQFYADFRQTSDEEVRELLAAAAAHEAAG
jgi:putative phosphoribosyl transferase